MRQRFMRAARAAAAGLLTLAVAACGGGGGGSSATSSRLPVVGANQLLVTVTQNPDLTTISTVNIPYVTVTVCDASAQCRSIDHIVLDTGSYGLRVLQGALGGLNLPPDAIVSTGGQLGECARFLSGHIWGSVAHATLRMADETTSSLPIQVISPAGFAAAPSDCASLGTDVGTLQALQGNGLLGVGHFVADYGWYYSCSSGTCTRIAVSAGAQVSNPVAYFTSADNNGVVLSMPAVSAAGAATTYGTLSFGVGTQPDNSVTGYSVIPADSLGDLTVTLNGNAYPGSFLDSGSNFYYAPLSGVVPTNSGGYFVPSTLLNLPITLSASSGAAYAASMDSQMYIGNYSTMDFARYVAFNDIGMTDGTPTPVTANNIVDLGMPYFYGRSVAYVINGMSSPIGTGPLYAIH